MYQKIVKPLYFRMNPETAHHLTINGLSAAGKVPGATGLLHAVYRADEWPETGREIWGIRFPNVVGLAAGLDKDGRAMKAFSSIGFGFIEVGTVTPKPQPGNELPRLYRLPSDEALINRMGFNNKGADYLAERLKAHQHRPVPILVNIGKNKVTPNENAVEDYLSCLRTLYPYSDFFAINISSPNTPDLRKLQHGEQLKQLLDAVTQEMDQLKQKYNKALPILVKIAPDLEPEELESIVDTIKQSRVSGIIATNTTLSRDGLTHPNREQAGGLSGKPLRTRSTEVVRSIYRMTEGKLPIIGSGGIFTAEDAYEKIRAGASLVQIYTSLIYKGPGVNREIVKGLAELLRKDGLTDISQAVGLDAASS